MPMCLIAFDFQPDSGVPLRLVANRDERHDRPTAALSTWPDAPSIHGGRDLLAGGSWLAVHARGRFAAVTNVRDPRIPVLSDSPSRGALVRAALDSADLDAWLAALAEGQAWRYGGFNLLVGNARRLWYLHRGHDLIECHELTPGSYGLSNARLDTSWPKLEIAKSSLVASIAASRWPQAALDAMRDSHEIGDPACLPDTGVGESLERFLSPLFIVGQEYGTRATTWLTWHASGIIEFGERRFGPLGTFLGESRLTVTANGHQPQHRP